jgi:hypothetical protein
MSRTENRLSIRLTVDTNLIGDDRGGPEMAALWELDAGGWIQLMRSDGMDTELRKAKPTPDDPNKAARLLGLSAPLQEQWTPWVLGFSELGRTTMLGTEADQSEWDLVWETINPGKDRTTARRQDVFDAMHVWSAIRNGSDAFVSTDGDGKDKGLIDRAEAVRSTFDGFNIWTPVRALAHVERRKTNYEFLNPPEAV